ncbi:glycoside hydrolase family 3 N-terminal domain-containing protein [Pseudonocardia xinjiangensis]|uniref:glycoside hydrolase family 3 N-terminal domain-containing protein n=1 Tax=Pseudonocardia xinjiangensis TaxID=75289 RepID=UPI003D8E9A98
MMCGATACGATNGSANAADNSARPVASATPVASAAPVTSAPPVAPLTPRQAAGQRIIYSYPGLVPPQALLDRIRAGEAGGVIFFSDNVSTPKQITGVVRQLRDAAAKSPLKGPLLLMTDQEGGKVRRLPGGPAASLKAVGQSADPDSGASADGRSAGQDLSGMGLNVNLAPVLDVYHASGDLMDQVQRSFSQNPALVGRLGADYVKAQQAEGVAATVKHFPGLGPAAAAENTDLRPVTLPVPLDTLRNVDEAPYRQSVSAGAKLVMLSWAVYPALDPTRPAGLSPVVQQELRSRTGFTGVTISDALEAGALKAYGATGNRAVLAAQAGADLILTGSRNVQQGDDAAAALATALSDGKLQQGASQAALARIDALRAGLR